jgi:peptide/nickel transport system substrate-binding protein
MNPRTSRVLAILVAIIAVSSTLGVYYSAAKGVTTGKATYCAPVTTNPLIFDSPETADSVDPTVTYTVPGWSIDQNVYQTLVMYNGSSETDFVGELAKNWTTSPNGLYWNFTLWPGEHFSNGDPLNAYVVWYSWYRSLIVNQPDTFLVEENFYVPGATYYSNINTIHTANATLTNNLNAYAAGDINNPSPSVLSYMETSGQSFQVLNNLSIEVHFVGAGYLDYSSYYGGAGTIPYAFLLDQISTVAFIVVDPLWIAAHGGVVAGQGNAYSSTHALGSGPYMLSYYEENGGWQLSPNPDYWAANTVAKWQPWNTLVQPALRTIQANIQPDPTVVVHNLETGSIVSGDFGYVGPSTLNPIASDPCLVVKAAPVVYGSTAGAWWIYMDQKTQPFSNWSVRAAIVHAINYPQVIKEAFGSAQAGTQWVGPVPPGYPDYNPGGLANYSYNIKLAWQEMNQSPWPYDPKTGSGGYPNQLNFEYVNSGDFPVVALLLQSELGQIGIRLNLEGMSYNQLILEQTFNYNTYTCPTTLSINGGPYPIGMDFYSADYVAPDDATQLDAISYGFYNQCMSQYANSTIDTLVLDAAGESNATLRAQEYAQMTQAMYVNYTDAWLVVPTFFQVYSVQLTGLVPNAMGSSIPASFEYNTYTTT